MNLFRDRRSTKELFPILTRGIDRLPFSVSRRVVSASSILVSGVPLISIHRPMSWMFAYC